MEEKERLNAEIAKLKKENRLDTKIIIVQLIILFIITAVAVYIRFFSW